MAKHYVMLIDSRRCIDCKACQLACKTEHNLPGGHWRNWIHAEISLNGPKPRAIYQPGACLHCENPTCVPACPTGATFRDASTGEVRIDKQACIGCGACVSACPYSARAIRKDLGVVDKCDFCAARRTQGLAPACVETCPTAVRLFGDAADPESPVARALQSGSWVKLEHQDFPTSPNLLYAESAKPDNWLRPARETASMSLLSGIVAPLVRVTLGVTTLGVGAAVLRQLFLPDDAESHDEKPHKEGPHE